MDSNLFFFIIEKRRKVMIGSMYSGISGLKANTSAMEVIGDNIANVDTTGFKASTTSFANVFSSTLTTDTPQAGNGTSLQSISAQWDSGALESTNSATDFSINGTGLFVVNDPSTEVSYYTRAGEFEWDKDGNLVTNDGFIVQGYSIATDGTVGSIDDISLPLETNEPAATENLTFGLNLNSDAEHLDTFPSSITTYNSLGSEVILDVTFTRYIDSTTGTDGWYWYSRNRSHNRYVMLADLLLLIRMGIWIQPIRFMAIFHLPILIR
jgi:flagellar hook protein FlgE